MKFYHHYLLYVLPQSSGDLDTEAEKTLHPYKISIQIFGFPDDEGFHVKSRITNQSNMLQNIQNFHNTYKKTMVTLSILRKNILKSGLWGTKPNKA